MTLAYAFFRSLVASATKDGSGLLNSTLPAEVEERIQR